MTNKLEKQFFSTFGIEPKIDCERCGAKEFASEQCYQTECEKVYPQITDRILLELICILSRHAKIGHYTMDGLKRQLLNLAIIHKKDILEQVRTLFEEG